MSRAWAAATRIPPAGRRALRRVLRVAPRSPFRRQRASRQEPTERRNCLLKTELHTQPSDPAARSGHCRVITVLVQLLSQLFGRIKYVAVKLHVSSMIQNVPQLLPNIVKCI